MESTSLFRDIGAVKRQVSDSLEKLVKGRQVELIIDDVEISHISDAALENPIRSFEELGRLGNLADEMIKPNPDISRHIMAMKNNPEPLVNMLSYAASIGKRALANTGVLGEDFLDRYPLQIIGRNSYAASCQIAHILSRDRGLANLIDEMLLIAPGGLKIKLDEKMQYLLIFSKRFPEYTKILRNAGIRLIQDPLKDVKSDSYVVGIDLEKRTKEREKEEGSLIEELSLPGKGSFRSLLSAIERYEDRISYKVNVHLTEIDRHGIDIDLNVSYDIEPASDAIPKDIFQAVLAVKKATFLINTFYKDNGIHLDIPEKRGNLVFTKETIDGLFNTICDDVDLIYKSVLSEHTSLFYHLADEKRIRKKPDLFEDLCRMAKDYESRIDHRALILPSDEYQSFRFEASDGKDISDLLKYAALTVLGGMQTILYYTPDVDKEHHNPNVEEIIKESIDEMRERSGFLSHLKPFFDGSDDDYLIAHAISKLGDSLDEKGLPSSLKDDFYRSSREISKRMLILQSELMGIPLNKGRSYRLYTTGENTMLFFQLAGLIESELIDQVNFNQVPMGKVAFTREVKKRVDDLLIIDKTKGKERYTEQEIVDYISDFVKEDDSFRRLLEASHDPVSYMKEKLSAFRSIPEALACNIEEAVKRKVIGAIRPAAELSDPENVCVSDGSDLQKLLDSCVQVFNKASPYRLSDVEYSKIDPNGKRSNLALCRSALSVLSLRGDRPEEIYSMFIHAGEDTLFEKARLMFPDDSIYFGPIYGVAVPFEISKGANLRHRGSDLFGASPSTVQVYGDAPKDLEERISQLKTVFHEYTHASHSGFRHSWRRLMALYGEILIDFMLKKYESHTEDKIPFASSNYMRINREIIDKDSEERLTYKDIVLSMIDDFSKVALGVGNKAEALRKDGFYEAGVMMPYSIGEGFYKVSGFDISGVMIEESNIAALVKDSISAIKKDDVAGLKSIKEKLKDYSEALTTIEETSAEVMSCICIQSMLDTLKKNEPGKNEIYSLMSRQVEEEFNTVSKVTIEAGAIMDRGRHNPEAMERELNERGWTYKKVLNYYTDMQPLLDKLDSIGISKLSRFTELYDFNSLRRFIKGDEREFYLPVNDARNFINTRYRKHIPAALDQIRLLGDLGWRLMFEAEDPSQVFIPMAGLPILGK